MTQAPAEPENGWYEKPFVQEEERPGGKKALVFVCRDGTKRTLNLLEIMMHSAGCLQMDVLDRRWNSEPRQGG